MDIRRRAPSHVVRGSLWYAISIGVTALAGFIYWWLAARTQTPTTVGRATAVFAAVLFTTYLTSMGLPVAVARFANGEPREVEGLWSWAVLYTTLASAVGTLGFVAIAPHVFRDDLIEPLFGLGVPLAALVFFSLVDGMSLAVLVEIRLVAMRAWPWVIIRVVLVGLLRLPFLFVDAIAGDPLGLLLVMAGIPALSGLIGVLALRRMVPEEHRHPLWPLPATARPALRFATVNWFSTLASQAPQFVVPLIVAAAVIAEQNASFYLAWMVTTVVFLIPQTIGQVVLAESSRAAHHGASQVRSGLLVSLALMVMAALGAYALSGVVTAVFGQAYRTASDLLPTLVAAGIPWSVTSMCLARVRALGRSTATLVITGSFAVLTLVPIGVLVAADGTSGAATGWLVGNILAAAVAAVVTWATRSAPRQATNATGDRIDEHRIGVGVGNATSIVPVAPAAPASPSAPPTRWRIS